MVSPEGYFLQAPAATPIGQAVRGRPGLRPEMSYFSGRAAGEVGSSFTMANVHAAG